MLRFFTYSLILPIILVSAKSRFVRQADENLSNTEGSGLQLINVPAGVASNLNMNNDAEGSGLMYDEEASGSNLLYDSETLIQPTNATETESVPSDFNVLNKFINITNSDVETLVIKVHLPQKTTNELLDDLKNETAQQTNPINTLGTAVSLTNVLIDLLGRIQEATSQ